MSHIILSFIDDWHYSDDNSSYVHTLKCRENRQSKLWTDPEREGQGVRTSPGKSQAVIGSHKILVRPPSRTPSVQLLLEGRPCGPLRNSFRMTKKRCQNHSRCSTMLALLEMAFFDFN